jgi:hypothetical protein
VLFVPDSLPPFAQFNATTSRTRGAKAEPTLTKYIASLGENCKGDGEEVSSSLVEVELTLLKCKLLLVGFNRRERFLGKRIAWYCMLKGWRGGGVICKL